MSNEKPKIMEAFQEYGEGNIRLVEWIIGLVIGELALILSQHLYIRGFIFYLFLFFSFSSIFIAVLIMYALVSYLDAKLSVAVLATIKPDLKPEEYDKEYKERIGRIMKWIANTIVERKAYRTLVLCFALTTAMMIILIISYLVN